MQLRERISITAPGKMKTKECFLPRLPLHRYAGAKQRYIGLPKNLPIGIIILLALGTARSLPR
jgi:hypothetical protein